MSQSPELIKPPVRAGPPSSPMASPIRAAAAASVEDIPLPESPPPAAFPQDQYLEEKRREEAPTQSPGKPLTPQLSKAEVDARYAKEFESDDMSDIDLGPAAARPAAAAAADVSDSKSFIDSHIEDVRQAMIAASAATGAKKIAAAAAAAAAAASASASAAAAAPASESKSVGGGGGGDKRFYTISIGFNPAIPVKGIFTLEMGHSAAAAAAPASESKSVGGGGGGGGGGGAAVDDSKVKRPPVTISIGSGRSIPLKDIYEELKVSEWTDWKDTDVLFGVVPYSGKTKHIEYVCDELDEACQSILDNLQEYEDDPTSEGISKFDDFVWAWYREAELANPKAVETALEDLIDFITAYCKLAEISSDLSADDFHEFCTGVLLMELTYIPSTDTDSDVDMPAAAAAAAAAVPKKRPAAEQDVKDAAEKREVKRRKVEGSAEDSDDADDEASSVASRKDVDDDE